MSKRFLKMHISLLEVAFPTWLSLQIANLQNLKKSSEQINLYVNWLSNRWISWLIKGELVHLFSSNCHWSFTLNLQWPLVVPFTTKGYETNRLSKSTSWYKLCLIASLPMLLPYKVHTSFMVIYVRENDWNQYSFIYWALS